MPIGVHDVVRGDLDGRHHRERRRILAQQPVGAFQRHGPPQLIGLIRRDTDDVPAFHQVQRHIGVQIQGHHRHIRSARRPQSSQHPVSRTSRPRRIDPIQVRIPGQQRSSYLLSSSRISQPLGRNDLNTRITLRYPSLERLIPLIRHVIGSVMEDETHLPRATQRISQQIRSRHAHRSQVISDHPHIVDAMHIALGHIAQEHQLHPGVNRRTESLRARHRIDHQTDNDVRILRQHSLHIIGLLSSVKLRIGLSDHLHAQLRESIPSALAHRISERTRRMPQQSRRVPPRPNLTNLITTQTNLTRRSSLLTTRPLSNRRHRITWSLCRSRCLGSGGCGGRPGSGGFLLGVAASRRNQAEHRHQTGDEPHGGRIAFEVHGSFFHGSSFSVASSIPHQAAMKYARVRVTETNWSIGKRSKGVWQVAISPAAK